MKGSRGAADARPATGAPPLAGADAGSSTFALPSAREHWVAPDAIRRLIGAWAYGALAEAERPGAAEVRRALAVASTLAELAHESARSRFAEASDGALWEIEVDAEPARIGELAGVADRDAAAALELLERAAVLRFADSSDTRVRLVEAACETAPAAVRVSWADARDALRQAGAAANALAAPLAVLRELARASGPVPDPAAAPHVRYSVRELEAATLFSRSTVSEALALLERASLVVTEARRGQTLRCALTPRAFGLASPAAGVVLPEAPAPSSPAPVAVARVPEPASADEVATPSVIPAGVVLLGEFNGTPIYGPRGTPLIVECDERGQWTCRVGPYLRLGPVA